MMRWIVGSSLQFRLLVVVVAGVMMFIGFTQLRDMPIDVLPEFTRPYVEIQTEALGLSAEEVEAMITTPMEADMLNGTPWVEEIQSESIPGLSSIKLYFEPGTDILDARQMTQERLIEVYALPSVSRPPSMIQPVSSANRCMKIGLTSDELSLIQMSVMARWTIRPRLMGVPGVANVSIWGQRERQLQVQVDPATLQEKGVALNQIIATTGNALWASPLTYLDAAIPGTGGFIDTPNQRLTIQHIFPISTAEQLAEVPVEGTDYKLSDVANVVEDHQPLIGDAIVDDASSLMLVVEKFPWANTLDVTRGVEEALDALRPGTEGIEMDASLFRPATFIETARDNLALSLLCAAAFVAVVLLLFLNDWRCGVIGVIAISVSLISAAVVIYIAGATLNLIVLAGLVVALGVVIDDAIVSTQNILRRLHQHRLQGRSEESISWIIREASVEMHSVLFYATLIVLLALAPVLVTEGVMGAFFHPLAYAYALALVCSLVVALTVTPALSVLLFRRAPESARESRLAAGFRRGYDSMFSPIVGSPAIAFALIAILVVAGLFTLQHVRQESMFPRFKEMDLVVSMDAAPGTSHPAMVRTISNLSRELREVPGVKNVGGHMGRAITSDAVADVNNSEVWVSIDPAADYDATRAEIERIVEGYSGFDRDVEAYLDERVTEEFEGEDRGLVVRVFGEDLKIVQRKAEEVRRMLSKVNGLNNPRIEQVEEAPRVEIVPDLERCKAHGIKPGDVRRDAAILLSGLEVGNLFEEQKVFEVVVWGVPHLRESLSSIENLLIESPLEGHVRLEEVADVRIVSGPTVIERESAARYVDVTASVAGRDLALIGNDVEDGLAQIQFPLEYRAEILGETADRMANQQRMLAFAAAAALGIFLIYEAVFGSWKLAILLFLMLPLSLIGGLIAAYATGGLISFGSLLGLAVIFAIAARNGMLLVHRYQSLAMAAKTDGDAAEIASFRTRFEQGTPLDEAGLFDGRVTPDLVLYGTRDRFLPVVLTAVATALAFAPFVYFGNLPGHEIMYPMAMVVFGGLVSATLVNLCVLPALYAWLQPEAEPYAEVDALRAAHPAVEPQAVPQSNGEPKLAQQPLA